MQRLIVLLLACINSYAVHAVDTSAAASITLDQVVIKVLERNSQLNINAIEARAAAARIRQARQTPALELKLELQNFAGSGAYRIGDRLETTLSLAKILEFGGKASKRGNLAQRQADLLRNDQDSQRLDVLAEAAQQFMHVVVDQHRLRIAHEQMKLLQDTLEFVTQRVKAGRSHVAEQRRVVIALARAEIEREHTEHELSTSWLKLATYWGATQVPFSHAEAPLFVLPVLPPFKQLETWLVHNPDLIRFATAERVAKANLRLAQSRRKSNFQLSAGIRHFNEVGDGALVLSASIPLGSNARAQPYIAERQYFAEREPYRYEQQRLALHSSLYAIYQELLHAQTAYAALSQRIIPQAEQLATDYAQGYKRGRFSLLELNQAQKILLDTRLEAVIAAANYHRFRIEIERLTGAELRVGVKP